MVAIVVVAVLDVIDVGVVVVDEVFFVAVVVV